ncbi:hypothetical protein Tsubulata_037022, partial [Turnera subulata]
MKLDEQKNRWVKILDELKDSILFIGPPHSFSVFAKHFPRCKAIAFTLKRHISFIANKLDLHVITLALVF